MLSMLMLELQLEVNLQCDQLNIKLISTKFIENLFALDQIVISCNSICILLTNTAIDLRMRRCIQSSASPNAVTSVPPVRPAPLVIAFAASPARPSLPEYLALFRRCICSPASPATVAASSSATKCYIFSFADSTAEPLLSCASVCLPCASVCLWLLRGAI